MRTQEIGARSTAKTTETVLIEAYDAWSGIEPVLGPHGEGSHPARIAAPRASALRPVSAG